MLHFHIRKVTDGQVSSALGQEIRPGHRVKLTGPYGRAFFRQGHSGRIVLVASGTGFAPMWSVAVAAIMEQPQREMVFIVQARSIRSLYMHAALCRLALFPNVTLIPMVSEPQQISHAIQSGRPTDHLPKLSPDDVVYTAGAPAMTDAVARIAKAAGARCYTDPFVQEPRTAEQAGLMSRLTGWLNEPKSGDCPAAAGAKAGADAARRSRGWRRQPLAGRRTERWIMRNFSAGDRRDIPPDGHLERRLGIVGDVAAPPRAIDAVERQRFDRSPDPAHRRGIERNVVRKTVHEAERTAVHRHHRDIAGEQRAPAFRARAPVHHRAAGEMSAGAHQNNVVR